jgi:outer membrane usher protein
MRPVFEQSSLVLSTSQEIGDTQDGLVYVGLHTPLGPRLAMNTSASTRDGENIGGVDLVKSESTEVGSYGWRVRDREGSVAERMASASYRGSAGRVEGRLLQFGDQIAASAQVEGGIAAVDGNIYVSNRINDAFAVVDVGVPDTQVFYENRPAGRTDANGKLLVTGLDPYQANAISIDPSGLPIDAEVPKTKDLVVPGARRGTTAKFNVTTNAQSAILVLTAPGGAVLPVGARITRDGSGETFVVGYDGEAFVRGLSPDNTISVELPGGGTCAAAFFFAPSPGEQVRIPLTCS